jgi:hypothetical protein
MKRGDLDGDRIPVAFDPHAVEDSHRGEERG